MDKQSEPNPFSTRYVRPGVIPYQRRDGGSLPELVKEFLDRCHGWASIIGPHGSGKSTLVASLKDILSDQFQVFAYRFSTTDRELRLLWSENKQWGQHSIVIVDGYEQLSVWFRWRLRRLVRRRGAMLLITAHRVYRAFPVLWQTTVDETIARQLRDALLASRPELQAEPDLEQAWCAARSQYPTDLRETLMSMYDWVEEQKQKRLASHDNSRAV